MSEPAIALGGPSLRLWQRLGRHRLARASAGFVTAMALACLVGPLLIPYQVDTIDLANIRRPPSLDHWMGTDDLGRDLLVRVLYGGRMSILIGVLAAFFGTMVGATVGLVAGFYGGRIDNLLMRFTDVMYAIPTLPLLIILASYTQAAVVSMVAIIGVLSWMATARVVRGEVLSIRETTYVQAARSLGATNARLMVRHVAPNVRGRIVVGATLGVGNAITLESSLSFLGLGVQPPMPTWGNLLMDAQATMATQPWLAIFPGAAILLVVLSVNFIGDGLQDVLDPARQRP